MFAVLVAPDFSPQEFQADKDLERTRILLAEMPRMLGDIITQTVSHEPDMLVVGEPTERTDLLSAARAAQPDVVVVGIPDHELPVECEALFVWSPGVRVLGVTGDGRRAFLWELRPQRTPLGEVSPQGLVAAIRTAVQARSTL